MRKEVDKRHKASRAPHEHMQEVELIAFHDELADMRSAMHLIKLAMCMNKMC